MKLKLSNCLKKMKILIFDNYDSFTYNLRHVVRELGYTDIDVIRNDKIDLDDVERYDKIILSPVRDSGGGGSSCYR